MSDKKIYIVVQYDEGFYETDKDRASIRAISDDLHMLLQSYSGSGTLITIDSSVFNTDLYLTIDDMITTQKGLQTDDYYTLYLEHKKKNKNLP